MNSQGIDAHFGLLDPQKKVIHVRSQDRHSAKSSIYGLRCHVPSIGG